MAGGMPQDEWAGVTQASSVSMVLRTFRVFVVVFIGFVTAHCAFSPTPAPRVMTVLAASSLTDAFKEIGAAFEARNPGVAIQFNFAGSQQLALQLNQGARADVFASADFKSMEAIKTLQSSPPRVFAHNRLVIIIYKPNLSQVRDLRDLSKPNLKLVIADATVPVGSYTLQMLDKASADASFGAAFRANVLKNVVSLETNVRQVVTKVDLGEADAGIVYTTDAAVAKNAGVISVPEAFNVIADYPLVALKSAQEPQLAQAFVDFVLGIDGQTILKKYGFVSP